MPLIVDGAAVSADLDARVLILGLTSGFSTLGDSVAVSASSTYFFSTCFLTRDFPNLGFSVLTSSLGAASLPNGLDFLVSAIFSATGAVSLVTIGFETFYLKVFTLGLASNFSSDALVVSAP